MMCTFGDKTYKRRSALLPLGLCGLLFANSVNPTCCLSGQCPALSLLRSST